jgi:hypothetical protein
MNKMIKRNTLCQKGFSKCFLFFGQLFNIYLLENFRKIFVQIFYWQKQNTLVNSSLPILIIVWKLIGL